MIAAHLSIVLVTLAAVLYADEQAFEWMRGKKKTLSLKKLNALHALTGIGLSLIVLTGGLMFIDRAEYLLSEPTFIAKMCFVLALVANSFFIGSLSKIAAVRSFDALTLQERLPLLITGGVSSVSWAGALTCGLLL